MTALMFLATLGVLVAVLVVAIPGIQRATLADTLGTIRDEVIDALVTGGVERTTDVDNFVQRLEDIIDDPSPISLSRLLAVAEAVTKGEIVLPDEIRFDGSLPSERALLCELEDRAVDAMVMFAMRGTPAWLPLLAFAKLFGGASRAEVRETAEAYLAPPRVANVLIPGRSVTAPSPWSP